MKVLVVIVLISIGKFGNKFPLHHHSIISFSGLTPRKGNSFNEIMKGYHGFVKDCLTVDGIKDVWDSKIVEDSMNNALKDSEGESKSL